VDKIIKVSYNIAMTCKHKKLIKKYGDSKDVFFYICEECRYVIIKKKPGKNPGFNSKNITKK
jgi:hypothetical protein